MAQSSTADMQSLQRFSPPVRFAVRLAWALTIGLSLTGSMATLPVAYAVYMRTALLLFMEPLNELGWSPHTFALWMIATQQVYMVIALIVAFMLVWQRPHDWMALLTGAVLVLFGTINLSASVSYVREYPAVIAVVTLTSILLVTGANWLLLVFPDGRFFPRWTALYLIPIPLLVTADNVLRLQEGDPSAISTPITTAVALWTVLGLAAQAYRYRYYLNQMQKQQVKWVVAGMGLVVCAVLLLLIADPLITPALVERPMVRLFYRMSFPVLLAYLPMAISMLTLINAILRRNLWSVDFTINRTLGYGVAGLLAVAALILLFIGGRDLFRSPLALAVLMLALALAFNPLHRFIQGQIDRRLYDLRYSVETYTRVPRPPVLQPGRLTGARIDRWELLDFIGRGATSEVYKGYTAEPSGIGQIVAIKVMPAAADPDVRMRFDREVTILESLVHPRIVRFVQHGLVDDTRYLVMQYIEGETLRHLLERRGKLPLATVQVLVNDIASALDYIHARGIIHRDLKPSNVMLATAPTPDAEPAAMLMDFGIAKTDVVYVTGNSTVGTIDYMAPEQIQTSGAVSPTSDIYALAVIVFEMLSGLRPFRGNPGQVLFAHLRQPPPDIHQLEPELPVHVSVALMRAMSKAPDDRYATAGDFALALRHRVGDTTAELKLY
ncbi:MAG: serine/threonine protein kinase [Chloroflexi bacterium]|nr:serine/threonine protein kinase [Chloroflexota bacterium]